MVPLLTDLTERTRATFRARLSGDPTGAPAWVRDIARVGTGPGWFEPDGVVWRVHGDLSTLVGGVAALLGQGAHPLALAGVAAALGLPRGPLEAAGRNRPLAGGQHLRLRRARRARVGPRARDAPPASAAPPTTDAPTPPVTRSCCAGCTWPSPTRSSPHRRPSAGTWAASAPGGPMPTSGSGPAAPRRSGPPTCPPRSRSWPRRWRTYTPVLEPVPADLLAFLSAPPGLSLPERVVLLRALRRCRAPRLPDHRPARGRAGPDRRGLPDRAQLAVSRLQLRAMSLALGRISPSEEAARWRLGLGPAPDWAEG